MGSLQQLDCERLHIQLRKLSAEQQCLKQGQLAMNGTTQHLLGKKRGGGSKRPLFVKNLPPYRIGKHLHKQNRAKTPKTPKILFFEYIWHIFAFFGGIAMFCYPVGGSPSVKMKERMRLFVLTIGSFLLRVELLCLQLCFGALLTIGASYLTSGVFCLQWECVSESLQRTLSKAPQL